MPFKINSLFTIIAVFLFILVASVFSFQKVALVNGHAIPDRYTLAPNSVVDKSESFPSSISILFSERPDPKVSYIHVSNSAGKRIDNNDFKITGEYDREGTVTVDKNLVTEDVYSVSWSTLSLDDGHVSRGTYVIGVGSSLPVNTAIQNVTENDVVYSPVLSVVKIPIIIGQVYVLGFVFSQLFIWKDVQKRGLRDVIDLILIRRFSIPIIILSIVMGIASTIIPLFQSAIISETQSEYIKNLALLYFETTNGQVWLIRIIFCAIIAIASYYYCRVVTNQTNGFTSTASRSKRTILLYSLLVSISIFIATNSFTSHSSSIATWAHIGILSDFVHSVVVSIWIGGLMYILYALLPNAMAISKNISANTTQIIGQPKSIVLLILSRFSVISTICVGLVGITGLTLAWLHLHTLDELLLSDYGRTLIIKLSLVLPVIILGGYHQFWISRTTRVLDLRENKNEPGKAGSSEKFSSLKTTARIECIFAAIVLCAASFLTVTSPPVSTPDNNAIKSIANTDTTSEKESNFVRKLETQGIPIVLVISPFATGFNNFTINIPGNVADMGQVLNISMEFKKTDLSLGPIYANLVRNNNTAYSAYGGYLSQAGEWDVKITTKRSNLYDLNYRVSFTVNKSDESLHQHHVDKREVQSASNQPSVFTPMLIGLSIIITALSTYFCINALNRLHVVQQHLGIRD